MDAGAKFEVLRSRFAVWRVAHLKAEEVLRERLESQQIRRDDHGGRVVRPVVIRGRLACKHEISLSDIEVWDMTNKHLSDPALWFYQAAFTEPLVCDLIVVEVSSPTAKKVPVKSYNSFLDQRSRKVVV